MDKKEKRKIHQVVVVDDHEIFRQGLKTLIKGFENLTIIGSLKNGKQLVEFLKKNVPDIIIMDIHMPVIDGIAASKYVKEHYPQIKIIALTMFSDSYTIDKAFKAGASAFLTKAITKNVFCEAIRHVLADKTYISADAAISYSVSHLEEKVILQEDKEVSKIVKAAEKNKIDADLSNQEIEIVQYISKGFTSIEIGAIMNLSPRSIEKYRSRMMKRLKVKNSIELVRLLEGKGLI